MTKQVYPIVATRAQAKAGLAGINREQRLYLVRAGTGGFSCLGFDVLIKKSGAVARWLGLPAPTSRAGTLAAWRDYKRLMRLGAAHSKATGQRCPAELTPQLIGLEGRRVAVHLPDGSVSRFNVGKSTGWMPIHLEIKRRDSTGGFAAYVPAGSTVRVLE